MLSQRSHRIAAKALVVAHHCPVGMAAPNGALTPDRHDEEQSPSGNCYDLNLIYQIACQIMLPQLSSENQVSFQEERYSALGTAGAIWSLSTQGRYNGALLHHVDGWQVLAKVPHGQR